MTIEEQIHCHSLQVTKNCQMTLPHLIPSITITIGFKGHNTQYFIENTSKTQSDINYPLQVHKKICD